MSIRAIDSTSAESLDLQTDAIEPLFMADHTGCHCVTIVCTYNAEVDEVPVESLKRYAYTHVNTVCCLACG